MKLHRGFFLSLVFTMVSIICISSAMAEAAETLNVRQRKIIPIAAFTASGNMIKLESALNEGMNAGLTVNEIKEVLIHSYAYAGFPRALNGIVKYIAVMENRKKRGISDKTGREPTPVPADFDRTAYGHKVRNMLVGRDISKRTSGYPVFTPIIDRFLVDHLFADIFYRDILTHQERELATISILAAMPGTDPQLKGHFRVSMNVGLSKAQLKDFVSVLKEEVSPENAERADGLLNSVLGVNASARQAKSLEVITKGKPTTAPSSYFTGHATVESRFSSKTGSGFRGGVVNFEAGARTAWHTHPLGQTLIITSGRGLVQSEGEAVQEVVPGDVVRIPANERHWHGAAPDSPMSHVAISAPLNGKTVDWKAYVTDEQYRK